MILMMIIFVYLHTNYSDEVVQLVQLLYYLYTVVRYHSMMTKPFMQYSQSSHTQLWCPYKASQGYTQEQTVFSSYILKIEGSYYSNYDILMFITQLRINFSMLRNLTHTICIAAKSSCKKDHGISSYVIASSMAHFSQFPSMLRILWMTL